MLQDTLWNQVHRLADSLVNTRPENKLREIHTCHHCCLAFSPLLEALKVQELMSLMVEKQHQIQVR